MATVDITDVRPNGNSFAEGRLNPPDEVWAPPLAPNGTTAAGHVLLREETFRPVIGGEDSFQPLEPSNLYETFGSRRKLIAGAVIVAALGAGALAYFFLAPAGEPVTQTAEPAQIVQSSAAAPVQAVPRPSPEPPAAVAWPRSDQGSASRTISRAILLRCIRVLLLHNQGCGG